MGWRTTHWAVAWVAWVAAIVASACLCRAGTDPILLNDDGGWCWFEDERAIVVDGKLFAASVAMGHRDGTRRGNIEVLSLDLKTGARTRFPLHVGLEADDHDSPALLALPDRRLLAMYGKHGPENRIYWRISERPADARAWGPESVYAPSASSRVTYSNLHWIAGEGAHGRIYDFFRGLDNTFKPSWMVSDDLGKTWRTGGLLIDIESAAFKHRPYVKYASDGRGRIHFAFTEGHPRDFDNSIFHGALTKGELRRSDGSLVRRLAEGPIRAGEATLVYAGDSNRVAWIHDLAADRGGFTSFGCCPASRMPFTGMRTIWPPAVMSMISSVSARSGRPPRRRSCRWSSW
jgi:hypothetical protein